MKISPCPNCGGNNQYKSQDVSAAGGYGPDLLPGLGSFWCAAKVNVVVCRDCGLTRLFAGREATEKLTHSKKWKHVDGSI